MISLPRILIIDDQYGGVSDNGRNRAREGLCRAVEIKDVTGDAQVREVENPVAEAVFCQGQVVENGVVLNDLEGTINVVREEGENCSLILLDVSFLSGVLQNGSPVGQAGDDKFGETVRRRLVVDFPHLPIVMLTSKHKRELDDQSAPYLSKTAFNRRSLAEKLLRFGRLSVTHISSLLELDAGVVVEDPRTISAFRDAFIVATGHVPVLILGESGTGKEIIARYAHRLSRPEGLLVSVNVAAIPAGVLESELFGHEKGAFTGATATKKGKFELADGGTLFLDEIGDMSIDLQGKLLRALQEREINRVGGITPIPVDIDLICATSRDLPTLVTEGRFRGDLYYRINIMTIRLPPLRERRKDIAPLARRFLVNQMSALNKTDIELSSEAIDVLEAYDFPGNVRELEGFIAKLAILTDSCEVIGRSDVTSLIDPGSENNSTASANSSSNRLAQKAVTLDSLTKFATEVPIDNDYSTLFGIKSKLDTAYEVLLQRLAGATLERNRDPKKKIGFNLQGAMQLLTGDSTLTESGPSRELRKILGEKTNYRLKKEDLEMLVSLWRQEKK